MLEAIRPYLELLYFVTGGPLLLAVAVFALEQIRVAKDNAKLAARRDAYRLAAEQVKVYVSEIIPLCESLDKICKDAGINMDNVGEVLSEGETVRVKLKRGDADKLLNAPNSEALLAAFLTLVNRLETFSVFFTSKVAAEGVAFGSVGRGFVKAVRPLMPLIVVLGRDGHWSCVRKLWVTWHRRLEHETLQSEAARIHKALSALKPNEIIALGTK